MSLCFFFFCFFYDILLCFVLLLFEWDRAVAVRVSPLGWLAAPSLIGLKRVCLCPEAMITWLVLWLVLSCAPPSNLKKMGIFYFQRSRQAFSSPPLPWRFDSRNRQLPANVELSWTSCSLPLLFCLAIFVAPCAFSTHSHTHISCATVWICRFYRFSSNFQFENAACSSAVLRIPSSSWW